MEQPQQQQPQQQQQQESRSEAPDWVFTEEEFPPPDFRMPLSVLTYRLLSGIWILSESGAGMVKKTVLRFRYEL